MMRPSRCCFVQSKFRCRIAFVGKHRVIASSHARSSPSLSVGSELFGSQGRSTSTNSGWYFSNRSATMKPLRFSRKSSLVSRSAFRAQAFFVMCVVLCVQGPMLLFVSLNLIVVLQQRCSPSPKGLLSPCCQEPNASPRLFPRSRGIGFHECGRVRQVGIGVTAAKETARGGRGRGKGSRDRSQEPAGTLREGNVTLRYWPSPS